MHKEKTFQSLCWNAIVSHNLVSDVYFGFITGILLIMLFSSFCYDKNVDQMSVVYTLYYDDDDDDDDDSIVAAA
jgi:hypothetical protein